MIKNKRSYIFLFSLIFVFFLSKSFVYADFWTDANSWYSGDGYDNTIGPGNVENVETVASGASEVIKTLSDMVNVIGTTVIVTVTIFLGIKYMFGSFEAKGDVKESLMNLLVACIFFFGWTSIWNLLFQDGYLVLNPSNATSYETVVAKVFNTLTNVANFLAIGAVLYIGLRYIFTGAKGKADLKAKSGQFILGIIMSFCAVGFLNLISTIVIQVFG